LVQIQLAFGSLETLRVSEKMQCQKLNQALNGDSRNKSSRPVVSLAETRSRTQRRIFCGESGGADSPKRNKASGVGTLVQIQLAPRSLNTLGAPEQTHSQRLNQTLYGDSGNEFSRPLVSLAETRSRTQRRIFCGESGGADSPHILVLSADKKPCPSETSVDSVRNANKFVFSFDLVIHPSESWETREQASDAACPNSDANVSEPVKGPPTWLQQFEKLLNRDPSTPDEGTQRTHRKFFVLWN
jgi:hypothetical protein